MGEWGDLIPLALTIAFSPVPLAGLLLLLLAPEGFRRGLGFSMGWVLGIAFAATVLALASTLVPFDRDDETVTGAVRVLLVLFGAFLMVSGVLSWRRRPAATQAPSAPRWIAALDHLSPVRATLIGFGYSAFRPKNLVVAAAAGLIIVRAQTEPAAIIVSVGIFTAVASVTMIAPVLVHAIGGPVVRDRLGLLHDWLMAHLPVITSATFVLLGLLLMAAGVTALVI